MEPNFEIVKDAVYGYIKIFDHEREIVDTPVFQRLRRVYQNTAVHYAYPCATHTRFSHSIGVMHVAGIFTERLLSETDADEQTKKEYYFLMRLWGLTHDIGHGPFSHQFDEIILKPIHKTDHEKLGAQILRSQAFPRRMKVNDEMKIPLDKVAKLLEVKTLDEWPLKRRIEGSDINERVLYYVAFGAYGADIIDYLLRDSYFTGAGYGNIDWQRLVYASKPFKDQVLLDPKAEEAFDSLLLARLFMFSTVYYHRTARAAVKLVSDFLKKAAVELNDFTDFVSDLGKYAELDENYLLFHPALTDLEERRRLLDRQIPYTSYKEALVELESEKVADVLSERFMTESTREKLPRNLKRLPKKAFFVDTPKLNLNPLLGPSEQKVAIGKPEKPDEIKYRDISKTSWGQISRKIALIRLFIHDKYKKHEDAIVAAFEQGSGREHY